MELFDVWEIDFMEPFVLYNNNLYILVAIDYVSKWVETQAFPTNDAKVVTSWRKTSSQDLVLQELSSMMEGSHSCNKAFEALQAKYGVKHKVAQLTIHKQVVKIS